MVIVNHELFFVRLVVNEGKLKRLGLLWFLWFLSSITTQTRRKGRMLEVVLFDSSESTTLYFDYAEAWIELVRLHLKHCRLISRCLQVKPVSLHSKRWHLGLNCCFPRPGKLFLNIHRAKQQDFEDAPPFQLVPNGRKSWENLIPVCSIHDALRLIG